MSHDHHHHDHHHHNIEVHNTSMKRILTISIILNLAFVVAESAIGLLSNSLGLVSDAGHNLSDVFSLVLVLVGFHLAKRPATSRFTYGYKKSTVLISLLNAIILLIAVGAIVVESIHKLQVPPTAINGAAITWTAAVGILINGATTLMLMKGGKRDLNVKGAYLHMAADTLVSVGVVVSGIIISATGLTIIDPIISLVIAAIILFSTLNLLTTSLRLALDGTPQEIDVEQIERTILNDSRITDVHHIHLWAMSTT